MLNVTKENERNNEEVLFATQAAYNHYNDNQWACKDRYVHRTLYKIL